MKTCRLLSLGLAVILAAGCASKVDSTRQSTAPAPALAGPTEAVVPLPAHTPYDANPKARAIYLQYYAMGYQLAVTDDYGSPGCLCESEGDAERYEAAWNGFIAGKKAGRAHYQQAPATSDTPTAIPNPATEKNP